ncbi:NosR/NirI family transcriptional regulator, nitrous oxide reductase regulator [Bosea lathyri]|uniref:NosR/NirI family transcriptional regulator, nitrous oxide reductase regulator n=2 Tax=Bosea lathyri TaxID=1036778 RepID=A0A1H6AR25_9HYPH|nr:NosR/NirI family transcriptional regulator, nitrous oxide reductase regulator [Bosea lathyri]
MVYSPSPRKLHLIASSRLLRAAILLAATFMLTLAGQAMAAGRVQEFLSKAQPAEFFAEADRFGLAQGDPPLVPAYKGDQLLGFVYLNSDFANATGYSGKPIHMLIGIDPQGVVRGLKLVDHKEPIVLIGIPERRIIEAMNRLIGKDLGAVAVGAERPPQVDIVSGATVTVLVMGDSVVRSAVRLIKSGRLGSGRQPGSAAAAPAVKTVDLERSELRDWETLLGDGSVRRLSLTIGEVSEAFAKAGNQAAADNPEPGDANDPFIDLYLAPVSVPTIGRSLLGDAAFEQLRARLKPGQQAIVVAGDGAYSFKGSGYVRGGIFDRVELVQDGQSTRFRDRNHSRLGAISADGAPDLREIALFVVPEEFKLDLAEPWQLQVLVQRSTGARDKAFLNYELGYTLPDRYLRIEAPAARQAPLAAAPGGERVQDRKPAGEADAGILGGELDEPLWQRIWKGDTVSIGIAAFAILVLTGIFFFQDALVRRPTIFVWVRRGYLTFTLVWLGWYANAQLSVVNVLTFTNALISGFNWEFFLAAPLIFILWAAIAVALLFWGRGPFCGWLCPFGALQELINNIAQWLKVPQIKVPWGLHERLWPIKYIIFLGLFGLSLYSVALAEVLAEVEPFKTAIILKFVRDWPFVIYALTLLAAGLFIERFFCRYLCPLGAALAIPGRIRMFEWLKRWPECGSPCQRCANECPVQAIHPEGQINVNECIYCMHCQELYHDDHRCPHMIQVRLKREKREALSSPSMRQIKEGRPGTATPIFTHMGQPIREAGTAANAPATDT